MVGLVFMVILLLVLEFIILIGFGLCIVLRDIGWILFVYLLILFL